MSAVSLRRYESARFLCCSLHVVVQVLIATNLSSAQASSIGLDDLATRLSSSSYSRRETLSRHLLRGNLLADRPLERSAKADVQGGNERVAGELEVLLRTTYVDGVLSSVKRYSLQTAYQLVRLEFPEVYDTSSLATGQYLEVYGRFDDTKPQSFLVSSTEDVLAESAGITAGALTTSWSTITVPLSVCGSPAPSAQEIEDVWFANSKNMKSYFGHCSYSQAEFTSQVVDPVSVCVSDWTISCNLEALSSAADQQLLANGVDVRTARSVIYIMPNVQGCLDVGLSSLGPCPRNCRTWMNSDNW